MGVLFLFPAGRRTPSHPSKKEELHMLLVGNGKLITRNETLPYLEDGAVAIDGQLIKEVGPFA